MKSPFKFLDSYTREDRSVFFGRDQEITELYRRVFESKMLLVYGISGTGKSSLVNCGLASRFDESDWLPVNVRRGNNIIDSLNDACNKQALTPLKKNQNVSEKLQSIYLDHFKPVYLLFDQFEELFIFGSQEERTDFIGIVKEITDSETQFRIIFIIREEFLAGMTEFEEKLPEIFTNRFRVEKMKRANAISAVEGPCKVFGIETEPGFSEDLIDKLCPAGNEIELTYLQIYLDRIFRLATIEKPGPGTQHPGPSTINFTNELLSRAGSVSDLLGQFLDEQIRVMEDPEISMSILKSFVTIQGTKKQMTELEIQESVKTFSTIISAEDLAKYLNKFVDLRLLRERDDAGHYELRHDAIANKIYEKFTALEKDIIEVRHFIENAWHEWQKRSVLLSSEDLEYIAPYENRLFLSKECSGLIEKSKDALIRARRRRRNIAVTSTIGLLLILAGFTVWALKERINALDQSRHSKVLLLVAKAKESFNNDPTKAIRYAQLALKYDSTNGLASQILSEIFHSKDTNPFYSISLDHNEIVRTAIFSPDGKTILTSSNDGMAKLWDLSGNCLVILSENTLPICSACFSPDGKYVLTASEDKTAKLWDVSGKCLVTFLGHSGYVYSACFSPDGKSILTASADNTAKLWDLSGKCILTLTGHKMFVLSACFSPDGTRILTFSGDGTAKLWDLSGKCLITFPGQKGFVNSAIFSPNGKNVLTASSDNTAKLWDLSGKRVTTLSGHSSEVNSAIFSPNGRNILTASLDNTAKLWDLSGKCLVTFSGHTSYVLSAVFSSDGNRILTVSNDSRVRIWDLTGNCLATLSGHLSTVTSACFSPDNESILTASNDYTVKLWLLNDNYTTTFKGHSDRLFYSDFSPNGKNIVTASLDSTAKIWDLSGKCLTTFKGHTGKVFSAVFSPDGKYVLTSSEDNSSKLWDLSGNCITTFYGHLGWIFSAIFSPDGKYILTGSLDNTARLWDLTGKCLDTLSGHKNLVLNTAFSHRGQEILTSSFDKTAKIWDLSGKCLSTLSSNSYFYTAIFSSDDKEILTSSGDEAVRFWDLNGKCIAYLPLHIKNVFRAVYSPNENIILTCGGDKTAKLWDLKGNCLATLSGHTDAVSSAIFSPDGLTIITASWDKTAKLWYTPTHIKKWINSARIGKLTATDKAEVGESDNFNELILSNSLSVLLDYVNWYLSIWDTTKAEILYERAIQLNPLSVDKRLLGNIYRERKEREKYLILYKDEPQVIIKDDILSMQDTSADKNYKIKYDLCSKKAKLYEELLQVEPSIQNKIDAASNLNEMGWYGIFAKEYSSALKAIQNGIELDSSNTYLYSNLPLCYILTGQFEKAKEIYLDYIDKPFLNGTFKDTFLGDINDLEKAGITHPDFEKVKEMLKK